MVTLTRRGAVASATVAALTLFGTAACGGGEEDTAADGELTSVTVGVIPIIDIAPLRLGIDQGFFEERGLDVTTQDAQGGAAIAPAVVAGDFDFGYSNAVSLMIAREQGLPFRVLAVGARAAEDPLQDGSGQLMVQDPAIQSVEDLVGRRVAINTLKGINEVAVRASLEDQGVDSDAIEFVEVPIPNMPAALAQGDVDAAMMGEPFTTMAADDGARPVAVSYAQMNPGGPFAGWFTTETYMAENSEVVESFQDALVESLEYAEEHPDEARAALDEYLDLPEGASQEVTLPGWDPTIDPDEFARLAELAAEYGLISDTSVVDELLQD